MKISRLKLAGLVLLSLATMFGTLLYTGQTAHAYTNEKSPDPGNTTGGSLAHLVAKATYINVPETQLVIYAGTSTIGVSVSSADMCDETTPEVAPKIDGMVDNEGSLLAGHTSNGNPVTTYSVEGAGYPAVSHNGNRNSSCSPGSHPNILNGDGTAVTLDSTSQKFIQRSTEHISTTLGTMYKYTFDANWVSGCNANGTDSCGVNYFTVKAMGVNGSSKFDQSIPVLVSQVGDSKSSESSGIGGYGSSSFINYGVEFGADCNVTANTSNQIDIYDDDNANNGGAQQIGRPYEVLLQQQPKIGPPGWTTVPGNGGGFTTVTDLRNGGGSDTPVPAGGGASGIITKNNLDGGWLAAGTSGSRNHLYLHFVVQPDYEYRLNIRQLDPHNNLQFTFPYTAIDSYKDCEATQTQEQVTVTPSVSGHVNPDGTSATFVQSATISNFPTPKQWGYDEMATQNANNVGQKPQVQYYNSSGNSYAGTAQLQVKCGASNSYTWRNSPGDAGNCTLDKFDCNSPNDNDKKRNLCNNFNYRCLVGSGDPGSTFYFNDNNDPTTSSAPKGQCYYYQHNCDTSNYKNYTNGVTSCGDRDQCEKSNGNPVGPVEHNLSAADVNAYNCHIYHCAYWNSTTDPTHIHEFYDASGDGPSQDQNTYCEYRCQSGAGERAWFIRDDDAKALSGEGDQHCYIPPTFYIQCTWSGGEGSTSREEVTYDTQNNEFCSGVSNGTLNNKTNYDGNGEICEDTTPSGWPAISPFSFNSNAMARAGPPPYDIIHDPYATILQPGKGTYQRNSDGTHTGDFSSFRTTWSFNVLDTPPSCVQVGIRPYFSILGGDVTAGPGFRSAGTCTASGGASIIGSNSNTTPYNGSTAQLAALALTNINSFASGKTQTGASPTSWTDSVTGRTPADGSPSELAFANDAASGAVNPSANIYGGNYDPSNWCVPDYYGNAQTGTTDPTSAVVDPFTSLPVLYLSSLGSGDATYYHNGSLEINASLFPAIQANGQKIVLKVNGNVYITGVPGSGVSYVSASTLANIPQFQLLAAGNINVNPNVTNLDGFYDAQGNDSRGGTFGSCADQNGPLVGFVGGISTAGQCSTTSLTVNGGVAAKLIVLSRTKGDFNGNFLQPLQPAETFTYSPQFWLPDTKVKKIGKWDSVTSLPPIL